AVDGLVLEELRVEHPPGVLARDPLPPRGAEPVHPAGHGASALVQAARALVPPLDPRQYDAARPQDGGARERAAQPCAGSGSDLESGAAEAPLGQVADRLGVAMSGEAHRRVRQRPSEPTAPQLEAPTRHVTGEAQQSDPCVAEPPPLGDPAADLGSPPAEQHDVPAPVGHGACLLLDARVADDGVVDEHHDATAAALLALLDRVGIEEPSPSLADVSGAGSRITLRRAA